MKPLEFFLTQCYFRSELTDITITTLSVLLNWINNDFPCCFGTMVQFSTENQINWETNVCRKTWCPVHVKMRLYGLCPALHPRHLLEKWNSRHVVIALKGFTSKFNPKMRDVGIWVGSECRLAKEDHKAHKQMWWWEGCRTNALTPILFFSSSWISLEERFSGPKAYILDPIRPRQASTKLKHIINC